MQFKKFRLQKGIIDPITLIGVLFLIVTLGIGTYVVADRNISLNINEQAASCFQECRKESGTKKCNQECGTNIVPGGNNASGDAEKQNSDTACEANGGTWCSSTDAKGNPYSFCIKDSSNKGCDQEAREKGILIPDNSLVCNEQNNGIVAVYSSGTNDYRKCVNGKWEINACNGTCAITDLSVVPVYLKEQHTQAVEEKLQAEITTQQNLTLNQFTGNTTPAENAFTSPETVANQEQIQNYINKPQTRVVTITDLNNSPITIDRTTLNPELKNGNELLTNQQNLQNTYNFTLPTIPTIDDLLQNIPGFNQYNQLLTDNNSNKDSTLLSNFAFGKLGVGTQSNNPTTNDLNSFLLNTSNRFNNALSTSNMSNFGSFGLGGGNAYVAPIPMNVINSNNPDTFNNYASGNVTSFAAGGLTSAGTLTLAAPSAVFETILSIRGAVQVLTALDVADLGITNYLCNQGNQDACAAFVATATIPAPSGVTSLLIDSIEDFATAWSGSGNVIRNLASNTFSPTLFSPNSGFSSTIPNNNSLEFTPNTNQANSMLFAPSQQSFISQILPNIPETGGGTNINRMVNNLTTNSPGFQIGQVDNIQPWNVLDHNQQSFNNIGIGQGQGAIGFNQTYLDHLTLNPLVDSPFMDSFVGFLDTNNINLGFPDVTLNNWGNTISHNVGNWWNNNVGVLNFNGLQNSQVDLVNRTSRVGLTPDENIISPPSLLDNSIDKTRPIFTKTNSTISQDLQTLTIGRTPFEMVIDHRLPTRIRFRPTPYTAAVSLATIFIIVDNYYDLNIVDTVVNWVNITFTQEDNQTPPPSQTSINLDQRVRSRFEPTNNILDKNISYNLEQQNGPVIASTFYTQTDTGLGETIINTVDGPRQFRLIGCGPTAVANILNQLSISNITPLEVANSLGVIDWGYNGTTLFQDSTLVQTLTSYGIETELYNKSFYNLPNYTSPGDLILIGGNFKYQGREIPHISYIEIGNNNEIILKDNLLFKDGTCQVVGNANLKCSNDEGETLTIDLENSPVYIINP